MNKTSLLIIVMISVGFMIGAEDFGSAGARSQKDFELDEMLNYALQDEHLALAEYKALMKEFDLTRPYSNIARSEETHISYLEELYQNHGINIPEIEVEDHLILPTSASEAARIGVQAEINNIAMYEIFLAQDLPTDVLEIFIQLKRASENHLQAFQRQVNLPPGRGRNKG
jgi:hypothetical protein